MTSYETKSKRADYLLSSIGSIFQYSLGLFVAWLIVGPLGGNLHWWDALAVLVLGSLVYVIIARVTIRDPKPPKDGIEF